MNQVSVVKAVAASAAVSRDQSVGAAVVTHEPQRPQGATCLASNSASFGGRCLSAISDAQALSHLSDGDTGGFWILWESYQGYLFGVCLKQMGGVREDAEDALSRAMMKAWDRLPRYAGEIANVKAWLTRLVCNLCLDIHRERKIRVRNAMNLDDAMAVDSKSLALDAASPEAEVLSSEICNKIRSAVDRLPPRLREPFKMRFFEEMSYRDIAAKLDLSGDNVRKRIQLARAIMQERLSDYLPYGSPVA
ncbi:MAG TPA: sigma-70 family RNA polymerase sigma factor [Blastocatellia bacterium]|nr:sigma-70 family RNA polymerase sigma factor [Blastocatellia bacterium]